MREKETLLKIFMSVGLYFYFTHYAQFLPSTSPLQPGWFYFSSIIYYFCEYMTTLQFLSCFQFKERNKTVRRRRRSALQKWVDEEAATKPLWMILQVDILQQILYIQVSSRLDYLAKSKTWLYLGSRSVPTGWGKPWLRNKLRILHQAYTDASVIGKLNELMYGLQGTSSSQLVRSETFLFINLLI